MATQRIYHILFPSIFLIFASCSHKSTALQSSWLSPVVDGKPGEWTNFHQDKDFNYALANDAQFLYLCVTTNDRINTIKIMRNGLLIWLDSTGNTLEAQGIRFPIPAQDLKPNENMQPGERPDAKIMTARFRSSKKSLSAIGLKNIPEFPMDYYASLGIQAAADIDDRNVLTLEYAIPFSLLNWQPASNANIGVGFFLEAMTMPGGGGRPSGGMPPGGGPPDGGFGGGPGGGMPPGGGDFEKMFEDVSFWRKFSLSKINN